MPRHLVDVPSAVSQVAQAALHARAIRQAGGTARGVVIATALAAGHATYSELMEAREWHRANAEEVREGRSSLLGGLYGGAPGRSWVNAAAVAAARNPEGVGAMIAVPVPAEVVKALARDDGEPPSGFHLTLFHLASDAAALDPALRARYAEACKRVADITEPPEIELTHIERFSPTDEGLEPVVVVSDDPDVYQLRQGIETELRGDDLAYGNDHAFRAHVTIGYYPPGDGPEAGPLDEAWRFTPPAVEVHWGPQVTRLAFPGPAVEPPAPASGHYILTAGLPVDGPFASRAEAREHLDPSDDGIVYLDGSPLACVAAPPSARVVRRRRARVRRLQATINRIDRTLARKVHAAAEAAFREAIRRASVNLRQKARTNAQKDALVAARGLATPAVLAALGLEEERLVTHSFDEVGDLFRTWAAQAERDKLAAAAKELAPDPDLGDPDVEWGVDVLEGQFGAQIDHRTELAAGLLVAGLGRYALARLSQGPSIPKGERVGDVPFGIVRSPLNLIRTGGEQGGERTFTERLMYDREPGLVLGGGEWVHGFYGEPTNPFEPHANLDGVGGPDDPDGPLLDPDDPRLENSDSFPEAAYYDEGDHDGCTCHIVTEADVLDPGEEAESESEPEAIAAALPISQPATTPALARVLARSAMARSEAT